MIPRYNWVNRHMSMHILDSEVWDRGLRKN